MTLYLYMYVVCIVGVSEITYLYCLKPPHLIICPVYSMLYYYVFNIVHLPYRTSSAPLGGPPTIFLDQCGQRYMAAWDTLRTWCGGMVGGSRARPPYPWRYMALSWPSTGRGAPSSLVLTDSVS